MAEGLAKSQWSHTSEILAMLANCHSKKRYTGRDFNPTLGKQVVPAKAGDVGEMLAKR